MKTHDDIFEVARQLPAGEREAYLQEACRDEAQRKRVRALLEEAGEADAFFEESDEEEPTPPLIPPVAVINEKAGDVIGPYTLRQRLGEGGFGVVWMAEQKEPISRMVALKVVKAGMDTKQVLARFAAERQALAMMDHPHIAHVLDAGATESGRPYFAMELVKGIPITKFCDERGFSTRERLALFRDVCSAINHAHQKGIIHRDIKPSNVMITLHGDKPVVKVIDFGIAKATQGKLTDQTLFTRFEQFIGTPAYMSPEQAVLSGLDIDTRSDVYALGILLYELLTGETPFDGKTLLSKGYDEMRRIIREVDPPKPSSKLATLSQENRTTVARTHHIEADQVQRLIEADLDWIIMKAIEKDRARRYDTANALSMDIKRYLENEPVTASPPSTAYQFKKFARRHKGAFRTAAVIAVALVAGTVISTWQAIRATRAEGTQRTLRAAAEVAQADAMEQRKEAEEARREEQRLRHLAQLEAYAADMKAAQAALQQSSRQQAVNLLDQYWPKPGEPDLRGPEWRLLWQESRGHEAYTWGHPGMVSGAVFSPNGKEMVTASFDGILRVWNVASGKLIAQFDRGIRDEWARLSFCYLPDGESLVTASRHGLTLLDTSSWLPKELIPLEDRYAGSLHSMNLRSSPDGQWVAMAPSRDNPIRIWNTQTWESFDLEDRTHGRTAFSPDGKSLAIASVRHGAVTVWDLESRERILNLKTPSLYPDGDGEDWFLVEWTPDGKRLVGGSFFGQVAMWDARTGTEIWSRKAHGSRIYGLAVSHDGSQFASGGFDQRIHIWDTTTRELRMTLQGHLNEIWSLKYSPDDRFLVTSSKDGTAKLWDAQSIPPKASWALEADEYVLGYTKEERGYLTVSPDRSELRRWRGPQLIQTLQGPHRFHSNHTVFSPSTQDLHVLVGENELQTYDANSLELLHSVTLSGECSMLYHVSPDGRWLTGRGLNSRHLLVWNLRTGEMVAQVDTLQGSSNSRDLAIFSPDGRILAYADVEWKVVLLDVETWEVIRSHEPHPWRLYALSFSPDSQVLASSSWAGDIRLTEVAAGDEATIPLLGHGSGVHGHSFSSDGATILSGGDDYSVRMWNVGTGREMLVFPAAANRLARAPFSSPKGDLLIWMDYSNNPRPIMYALPTFAEIQAAHEAVSVAP